MDTLRLGFSVHGNSLHIVPLDGDLHPTESTMGPCGSVPEPTKVRTPPGLFHLSTGVLHLLCSDGAWAHGPAGWCYHQG